MGSGQQWWHGWPLPAGRTRPVRLPPHLLLAGARARPVQLRFRLDCKVRIRAEGLEKARPHLSMKRLGSVSGWGMASALVLGATLASAQAPVPSGGTGTLYVGTYARNILVIDEAT